ncbi:MAG: polysaccharide deacetylase family protein [Longicatena sp.]
MKKSTIYKCIAFVCFLIGISLCIYAYIYTSFPMISFKDNPVTVEINNSYQPKDFISSLRNIEQKDIHIKDSINTEKLGTYELIYEAKNHKFKLSYIVVDKKKPIVEVQTQNVSIHEKPDASIFIKSIKDDTKTSVAFKEAYEFNTLGDKTITLVVTDEAKNTTEIQVLVHVLTKDEVPPVIENVHDFTIKQGEDVDLIKDVKAIDERDGNVKVNVDKGSFDNQKPGTYKITYSAIDRAGNIAKKDATISVNDVNETSNKIIYLTIDDGPSANTPKILDILDRYQVKATFFVSAQCPDYLSYIKLAHSKGHAIGLHTYSHNYAQLYANDAAYFADLANIAAVVKEQTGSDSHIIRFPGGGSNTISANYSAGIMTRLAQAVSQKGYHYYDWNSSSGDGNSAVNSATLVANAKSYGGGSPLMMLTHDHSGSSSSVDALPSIIEYYKGLGYTFKVVDTSVPGYHHGINN